MRFMQIESVLQTKNQSEPEKSVFCSPGLNVQHLDNSQITLCTKNLFVIFLGKFVSKLMISGTIFVKTVQYHDHTCLYRRQQL